MSSQELYVGIAGDGRGLECWRKSVPAKVSSLARHELCPLGLP